MKKSTLLFSLWCLLALFSLYPVTRLLEGSFPVFTVVWILVPLIVVWVKRDAAVAGFRPVPWRMLLVTTGMTLGGLLLLMLLIEPWSHTYQKLIALVLASQPADTTFAWLLRFPRLPALTGMALYSGLVTLFGEELFFRGWLLQVLKKRIGSVWAVVLQAALFVLPNLLAAFMLPALQGALYAGVYTFITIGLVGGWAANRTNSIWPSLVSATVCNLVLVALLA